jgi:ribosomal protein L24
MEGHRFKLGDKVRIHVGHNKGREGYIVGITSQTAGSDIIEVRLDPETWQTAKVAPGELHHAR